MVDNATFGSLVKALRDQYTGVDDNPKPIDPNQLDETQNCPACFQKMEAHPYYGPGSVVIDSCIDCKLAWLDHGELVALLSLNLGCASCLKALAFAY